MFAKLKGTIDSVDDHEVILDVHGVGYLVMVSQTSLSQLGPIGSAVSLLIETHVREDKIALYGFTSKHEQEWFRRLVTVQGVGAKVALGILSVFTPDALLTALSAGDAKAICRADGVGPKLGNRIVAEFKGKLPTFLSSSPTDMGQTKAANVSIVPSALLSDAVSALVNLGYGRTEAYSAVITVKGRFNDDPSMSDLIKLSLQELAA